MAVQTSVSSDRSPRYPRIPMNEAVDFARKLYNGVHRNTVETDTAYKVMGFAGKNGASASVLGAVRQFGLVKGMRGEIRVSDLGLKILEPSSTNEKESALREAINEPAVFGAINTHFQGELPKADEPIRAYLIRTMDFTKAGADDCIKVFRTSLSQVNSLGIDEVEVVTEPSVFVQGSNLGEQHAVTSSASQPREVSELSQSQFVRIPLSRDCVAEVRLIGDITIEGIERLQAYIELMKPIWAN